MNTAQPRFTRKTATGPFGLMGIALSVGVIAILAIGRSPLVGPLVAGSSAEPTTTQPAAESPSVSAGYTADPAGSSAPAADLNRVLEEAVWVAGDDTTWYVGDLTGAVRPVPFDRPTQMTVADGRVVAWQQDGSDVTAYEVDPRTGTPRRLVTWKSDVIVGAVTLDRNGTALFWHGGRYGIDGGLSRLDLLTGGIEILIAPTHSTERNRNLLFWSMSGEMLYSTTCDMESCSVDTWSAGQGVARFGQDFAPGSASDRLALGYQLGHGGGDHQAARAWQIYDVKTGQISTVAASWISRTSDGFFVDDRTLLLSGVSTDGMTYNIVLVDTETGQETLVLSQPEEENTLHLRRYLANTSIAVVGASDADFTMVGKELSILDLVSGKVSLTRARVGPLGP